MTGNIWLYGKFGYVLQLPESKKKLIQEHIHPYKTSLFKLLVKYTERESQTAYAIALISR